MIWKVGKRCLFFLAFLLVSCFTNRKMNVNFAPEYSTRKSLEFLEVALVKSNDFETIVYLEISEKAFLQKEKLVEVEVLFVDEQNLKNILSKDEYTWGQLLDGLDFKLDLDNEQKGNLVFVVRNSEADILLEKSVNIAQERSEIILRDIDSKQVFSKFYERSEPLRIEYDSLVCDRVLIYKANESFFQFPLLPYQIKTDSTKEKRPLEKISFIQNEIQFKESGNYCFVCEKANSKMYKWLYYQNSIDNAVVDDFFLEALKYICTEEEYIKLSGNGEVQKAIERYWLKKGGAYGRASILQNEYLQRINNAINLFSDSKLGHLTDRGMIYIVMGPPKRVEKYQMKEIWQYPNFENVFFVFEKNDSGEMGLIRNEAYEAVWNKAVDFWYNGVLVR